MSSKIVISVIRCTWFSLMLGGCCAAYADDVKKVSLDDLTIAIPANWEIVEDDKRLLTILIPREGGHDTFRGNVRLEMYKMPEVAPVNQVLTIQLRTLEDEFKLLGSGILRETTPGIAWMSIVPKSPAGPNEDPTKIDFMLVNGKKLYVLHCMAETDLIEKYQNQFEEIAKSIVFIKPVALPQKTANEEAREKAHKEGGEFGGVWFRVMVAAAVGYGVAELLRRLLSFVRLKRRKTIVVEKTQVEEKQPEENLYNKPTNWPLVFAIGVAILTAVALLGRPDMPDRDFGPLTPLVKWFFDKPG